MLCTLCHMIGPAITQSISTYHLLFLLYLSSSQSSGILNYIIVTLGLPLYPPCLVPFRGMYWWKWHLPALVPQCPIGNIIILYTLYKNIKTCAYIYYVYVCLSCLVYLSCSICLPLHVNLIIFFLYLSTFSITYK